MSTLDFKPFLPHLSSEMIFNEVAPHTSKNKVDKTITGFVYNILIKGDI